MLKVYKATAINIEAIHSGSTKPCLMTLADDKKKIIGDFVVKVFKPLNLEQAANTSKEIYGNVLAREFDLSTPKAVLATVGQELIKQLNSSEKFKGFNLEKGAYFATEYLENVLDYSPSHKLDIEDWQLENIFAFDMLIGNIDRRIVKPNLFCKEKTIYLIDHELSLSSNIIKNSFTQTSKQSNIYLKIAQVDNENFHRKHIFLEELRERNKINTINFVTFIEYLRTLNVNILDTYQKQMTDFGINTKDYDLIKLYLTQVSHVFQP